MENAVHETVSFNGDEFWDTFRPFYKTKPYLFDNKHNIDDEEGQKASAELGIRYLCHYDEDRIRYFHFKIIDKQKWMVTKIKYGI